MLMNPEEGHNALRFILIKGCITPVILDDLQNTGGGLDIGASIHQ
jgi:hypothetical protein